jgi:hypothetical protein
VQAMPLLLAGLLVLLVCRRASKPLRQQLLHLQPHPGAAYAASSASMEELEGSGGARRRRI